MSETPPSQRNSDDLPRNPAIQRIELTDDGVQRIAEVLGVAVETAPFRLPSSTVWQLTIPGADERPTVMLTLWPGIRRVDAISGPTTVVFTDIAAIDLVPGVEAQFRRSSREVLIVARGGKLIVRA